MNSEPDLSRSRSNISFSRVSGTILVASTVGILFLLLAKYWPVGPDYFYTLRPVTTAWFSGDTELYDDNHFGYFGSPWGIFLIAPTLLLSIPYGQALLTCVSLIALVFSAHSFSFLHSNRRAYFVATVLAVGNLHTFDLLIRGNIDAFLVMGLTSALLGIKSRQPLLVGVGLWLLSVKPLNVLLPIASVLWLTWHWSRSEKLTLFFPVGMTFLVSLPLFGFTWPIRYLEFVVSNPPLTYLQTSLWRGFEYLGLGRELALIMAVPVIIAVVFTLMRTRPAQQEWPLVLAVSANLAITPYALGSHYVLMAPVFAFLSVKRKSLLALWFLTLTPLSRLIGGFELSWIDVMYPIGILVACFWLLGRVQAARQQDEAVHQISASLAGADPASAPG